MKEATMDKTITRILPTVLVASWLAFAVGCAETDPTADDTAHAEGNEHAGEHRETEEGPRGGRLLEDGSFALEVTMFEAGIPPELRVYPKLDGEPVNPAEVELTMELRRLGGVVDSIAFAPQADFLRSTTSIDEPHSFSVRAVAKLKGASHSWSYDSLEGRVTIAPEMAKDAGVETAVAGAGRIEELLSLYGTIQANPERVRAVSARFPGIVRSVQGNVGEPVKQGQQLATVESNESLQTYGVAAPITGVITERHANPGEATDDEPLFQVADFSSVRAELNAFPRDRGRLRRGQTVRVKAPDSAQEAAGTIDFVAPVGSLGNQTLKVRVLLRNQDGQWTPGQFVEGLVTVAATELPLVIRRDALQTFRDWDVAFINVGDTYEIRPLELGRSDGEQVEILGGLKPGDRYVTTNSYLIKADIEKSGASHDH
jgi:cobalt-zinc-cadmium efflux system membrane fusion protein